MNAIMHVSFNQGGVVAGCFLLEDWGGVTTDLVLSKDLVWAKKGSVFVHLI